MLSSGAAGRPEPERGVAGSLTETQASSGSGGLDTSVILGWLGEQCHKLIAYVAGVGQQDDLEMVRAKALTGGGQSLCEGLQEEFVTDFIFPALSTEPGGWRNDALDEWRISG